jgi:hypothetical protein
MYPAELFVPITAPAALVGFADLGYPTYGHPGRDSEVLA